MFLAHLSHTGPQWDVARPMEEQTEWPAHASYMDMLVDEGIIVLGGPLDDMRVVLAMEVESEEAVRVILSGLRRKSFGDYAAGFGTAG
ncbi:hypothetical protein GCM10009556_103710 [Acrocarpospora pleiomorpha]|uniref:hypothetical protein n=2 Tax=Acrocarpospora pleiomorpha TaxID=90975 RepID=UPI0031DEB88E